MSLMSVTSRVAATKALFGSESTQVVYESNGNYITPNNKPPTTWYVGLFRTKSLTDTALSVVEGIGKAAIPNTDDFWDTDKGYAVNKKRIVFPGVLTGLENSDSETYIAMCGLYDADSTTATLWMTGQMTKGYVKIKNGKGFAADINSLIFVPDVSVAV